MDVPIIHAITELYKNLYSLGQKISKRDKFGLHRKIEEICLDVLSLAIESAFKPKELKKIKLEELRVKTEILKRLVRLLKDLNIIESKKYVGLQISLEKISMMAAGWIKYLN